MRTFYQAPADGILMGLFVGNDSPPPARRQLIHSALIEIESFNVINGWSSGTNGSTRARLTNEDRRPGQSAGSSLGMLPFAINSCPISLSFSSVCISSAVQPPPPSFDMHSQALPSYLQLVLLLFRCLSCVLFYLSFVCGVCLGNIVLYTL